MVGLLGASIFFRGTCICALGWECAQAITALSAEPFAIPRIVGTAQPYPQGSGC